MLFWRAAIAKISMKYKDPICLKLTIAQNVMTALIFGLVFLRYPRSSTEVPYNMDDQ